MKPFIIIITCCLICFVGKAQVTTVYEDLFGGTAGESTATSTIASGTAPNNTAWSYVRMPGVSFHTHQFTGGYVKMDASTSSTNYDVGTSMLVKYRSSLGGSGTFYEAGYNATLTNNTQNLEWSFNFYSSKTPDGITNGGAVDLGGAFILGMENNLIWNCGPTATPQNTGYAVIFGEATGSNYVKLVRFAGCYSPSLTDPCNPYGALIFNRPANVPSYNNTTCIISDNSNIQSGWYSVKVQYNPVNDEWRLFVRYDNASPADPQNLNNTHSKGAKVDNTYTNRWLGYIGLFGCWGPDSGTEGTNDQIRWDNIRIKRNVSLIQVTTNNQCGSYSALPVTLNKLELNCSNNTVDLSWTTASENNNDVFKIERSLDGISFHGLAEIDAVGFSASENSYTFQDIDPLRGVSYYRLIQQDFDGSEALLGTLSTQWPCKESSNDIQIYPNPTEGDLNLVVSLKDIEDYSVHLYNSVGHNVIPSMEVNSKEQGMTLLKIRTSELPAGIYLIKVDAGEKVYTEKLVINK